MIKLETFCAEITIGFKQKQKKENWIKSRASDNIITRRNTQKKKEIEGGKITSSEDRLPT